MPEEEEEEEEEEGKKEKKPLLKSPIIKILLGVIGLIVLLFVMIFVAKMVTKSGPKEVEVKPPWAEMEEEREPPPPPLRILVLTEGEEAIMSRLADVVEARLVSITQVNLAYEERYAKELDVEFTAPGRIAQIKDMINTVLTTKTSEDLITEEGIREVKDELIERINLVLQKGQIKDIYWQMVVQ